MTAQNEAAPSSDRRAKQPNSRHCFVCGLDNPYGLSLSFYETEPGEVVAEYSIPEHYQGYPGVAHGGVVAAMLDEVAGRAAMVGDHTHFMITAKLNVRYRKPVPVGQALRLVGRITRRRGRRATARAELWLPDGGLGAEAEATLIDLPDFRGDAELLDGLGWKVYPD